jgi:rubredoxin
MTDEEIRRRQREIAEGSPLTDAEKFLVWRDIDPDDACPECGGTGKKTYGSTATWVGGVGGQTMTSGHCDGCWGSGSRRSPWLDLRALRGILRQHPEIAAKLRRAQG